MWSLFKRNKHQIVEQTEPSTIEPTNNEVSVDEMVDDPKSAPVMSAEEIDKLRQELVESVSTELSKAETIDELQDKVDEFNQAIGITNHEWESLYNNPNILGYRDRQEQLTIFDNTTPMEFNINTDSVLDIGCGVGDYYAYLTEICKGIPAYHGIDYNQNMITMATRKFPEISGSFTAVDFLDHNETYDWIFAFGAFNINMQPDMEQYVYTVIDKMYEQCNKGIALNLIEDFDEADGMHDGMIKYSSTEFFTKLKSKYKNIKIHSGYLVDDFYIQIFKQ